MKQQIQKCAYTTGGLLIFLSIVFPRRTGISRFTLTTQCRSYDQAESKGEQSQDDDCPLDLLSFLSSRCGCCMMRSEDRLLLLQPSFQMPDLRLHTGREADLGLLPRLRPLPGPHALVLDVPLGILDLLDDVVVHREETPLD